MNLCVSWRAEVIHPAVIRQCANHIIGTYHSHSNHSHALHKAGHLNTSPSSHTSLLSKLHTPLLLASLPPPPPQPAPPFCWESGLVLDCSCLSSAIHVPQGFCVVLPVCHCMLLGRCWEQGAGQVIRFPQVFWIQTNTCIVKFRRGQIETTKPKLLLSSFTIIKFGYKPVWVHLDVLEDMCSN